MTRSRRTLGQTWRESPEGIAARQAFDSANDAYDAACAAYAAARDACDAAYDAWMGEHNPA